MQNSLIDAGPIIALFDKDDKYHKPTIKFIKDFKGKLITSWPVITEVSYFLNFNINVQVDFYKWIQRNAIQIINFTQKDLDRIIELTTKYSDIPMDLADCSLIMISELLSITNIITIDSEYYIYRTKNKKMLRNLLEGYI
jgi:predicted nucleic acid-binding protein